MGHLIPERPSTVLGYEVDARPRAMLFDAP